ncbi:nucleotidyltransferase domain-containing protein [Candidatus Woesearchaeota archaeon]|nr:nucleotidyltransferase domain-containing protein [Candidatus Woesearchaeota archaeon]
MEFKVQVTDNPNLSKYSKDDLSIAYDFSKKIHDEFGTFIKAIILFGSVAKNRQNPSGDIDLLVVIDDVSMNMSPEIVQTYRIIIEKAIASTSTRLHVTSLKLTTFWEYIRAGDPVGINILRDGVALLDTGFFDPMHALLVRGRIRPTPESIWAYFTRAPKTIHNSKWHIMQAVMDLYWAVIDSAHAALMKLGETPPSPDHAAELLEEKMVKRGLVERRYADIMKKFYTLQKRIVYREVKQITGAEYDRLLKDAQDFVNKMEKFIAAGYNKK